VRSCRSGFPLEAGLRGATVRRPQAGERELPPTDAFQPKLVGLKCGAVNAASGLDFRQVVLMVMRAHKIRGRRHGRAGIQGGSDRKLRQRSSNVEVRSMSREMNVPARGYQTRRTSRTLLRAVSGARNISTSSMLAR